jgi:hypothetical protein
MEECKTHAMSALLRSSFFFFQPVGVAAYQSEKPDFGRAFLTSKPNRKDTLL